MRLTSVVCIATLVSSTLFANPNPVDPKPIRVAVLGACGNDASASVVVGGLEGVQRERGITINTSHINYRTVACRDRAGFVQAAVEEPFGAAVLIETSPNPGGLLNSARLTRLMNIEPVLLLLTGGPYSDQQIARLRAELAGVGYHAGNSTIFITPLDGPPCPADRVLEELQDVIDRDANTPDEAGDLLAVIDETDDHETGGIVYGYIETGVINSGDEVDIVGGKKKNREAVVTGVELLQRQVDRAVAGDHVGLVLRGIEKTDIRRGMVIAKPGTVTAHKKFKAEVYVLKKEEGGRHTPFHNKYRPQFYLRTADVTGEIVLEEGREMVMPGDNVTIEVKLIKDAPVSPGLRFAIREGGRTVGAGQVTEIVK